MLWCAVAPNRYSQALEAQAESSPAADPFFEQRGRLLAQFEEVIAFFDTADEDTEEDED